MVVPATHFLLTFAPLKGPARPAEPLRAHKLLKHTIMKKAKRIIAVLAAAIVTATAGAQTKNNGVMENVLDRRQQHIVAIANLEARGEQGLLGEAISAALDDSVTVNDIKEALSQLYAYTGFPRSLNALGTLQRVVAERAQAGKASVEGRDADPLPEGYDALKQGTEVQTKLTGKPYDYKFAPATDYYLKAHLFGDIFARNNLTFAERELVTVSALSGIEGAEPQLRSHINGARNMGLSDAEIHSIPLTLAARGAEASAYRASKAIADVYSEAFAGEQPLPFAKGGENTAYAKYFIGKSYLAPLANGEGRLPVSNVTFEPRCRNNWHIHNGGGQILICVYGKGWYQEWGKPARRLQPGDVVDIPAGVKHWHGAAADSWFQHVAISVPAEGASTEWLEPVADSDYDKLK